MTKITAIAAIAAAVVLGCNPPTNPPPTPVQPKTPLKLVYGTDNTIQAVRNKALDSARPTLTPKGITAKYSISDAPAWLTVNADTGVLSAAADKTGTLTKGAEFTATVTATGVGGAYDKETAEAKIRINVVDELTITFNPPAGTTLPGAGEPHVTGTKNTQIEFGGTFTVNPPDPSAAYELDPASDPLPPGLTIDPKTGKITGTPTAPTKGPINIIIRVKDTTAKITLRLQINPDEFPAGMSYAATTIARGSSTSVALTGAEGVTAEYAFESTPAALSWLTIDPNTGVLSVGNAAAPVPATALFGTTAYKIKVTGTGQYAAIPPETLDFSLTVQAAMFPDPLNLNMGTMILNSDNRSGNASVTDSNDPKLTVTYTYAPNPPNTATPTKPSWLNINPTTGAITVTNAPNSAFPAVGATKTYKIRITGTGIYEGRTADIDFVTSGAAINLPTGMAYAARTTVEKGSSRSGTDAVTGAVRVLNATGVDAKYAFEPSPAAPLWLAIDEDSGAVSIGPTAADPSATVPADAHGAAGGEVTYKIKVTGQGIYKDKTRILNFKLKVDPAPIGTFTYSGRTVSNDPGGAQIINITAANTDLTTAVSTDDVFLDVSSLNPDIANVTFSISKTDADPTGTTFNDHTGLNFNEGKITGKPLKVFMQATYVITATGNDGTIYQGATSATKTINITVDPASIGTFTYTGTAVGTPTSAGVLPITLTAKNTALTTADSTTDDVVLDVSGLNPGIANVTFSINDATDFNTKTNLTFNTSGTNKGKIRGTPSKVFTAGATYTITATGDNGIYQGATATKRIRIKVDPASFGTIDYSDASDLVANIGTAITARTITAPTGAGHDNVTYSIAPNLNTNTGLNFNTANGTIDGTPTKAFPNTSYTITATGNDNTIYQGYPRSTTIAIRVPEVIPNVSYGGATVEKGSSGTTRTVSGAPAGGGLTYTLAATATPLYWLSINSTTGEISIGTTTNPVPATAASSYSIGVNVNGATGSIYAGATQKTVTFNLTVTAAVIPDLSYANATMVKGTAGERSISAGAPSTGLTYAFAADATRPTWLSIDSTTGRISIGTTTNPVPGSANSSYSIGVNVTGSAGSIYEDATQKTVTFNLTVTAATLPTNMSYGGTKTVARGGDVRTTLTNSIDAIYTRDSITVSDGADAMKAPDLVVNGNNGAVTGPTSVPATTPAGTYRYKIKVEGKPDSIYTGTGASSGEITFTLQVIPAPIPTTMSYSAASVLRGSAVTATLTNGIDANYTQQTPVAVTGGAVASSAPTLTFNTTNGAITGPTIAASTPVGTYTYTIRVTGKANTIYEGAASVDVTFALTVTQPLPTGMSYDTSYISRNASDPLARTITASAGGSGGVLKGGVSAAGAEYRFASSTPKPSWMSISTTGRITGIMPQTMPLGQHDYTIEVIGKGIYAGSTETVTFTLYSQGA